MAHLWTVTIGFIICLGIIGGTFFYFLRSALDTQESKKVDSPKQSDQ